ncbi:MAG: hypothetical protein KKB34_04880 [Bacteroidetes bacterium]|nr:hypothetical protein [Bacteroidota bacterium]
MNSKLEILYEKLNKIDELIKFARVLGEKVEVGEETITSEQLQEMRTTLKSQIAAELSQSNLRIVK